MTTKESIVMSALKLFSEKTFGATTIKEIADEAGVKPQVLNYHFKNKEDIFKKLVDMYNDAREKNCFLENISRDESLPKTVTAEKLVSIIHEHVNIVLTNEPLRQFRKLAQIEFLLNPVEAKKLFKVKINALHDCLFKLFREMHRIGRISKDFDIETMTIVASMAINTIINMIIDNEIPKNVGCDMIAESIQKFWKAANIQDNEFFKVDLSNINVDEIKTNAFEAALELSFKNGITNVTLDTVAKKIKINPEIVHTIFSSQKEFYSELNNFSLIYLDSIMLRAFSEINRKYTDEDGNINITIQDYIDMSTRSMKTIIEDNMLKYIYRYLCDSNRIFGSKIPINDLFYKNPIKVVRKLLLGLRNGGMISENINIEQISKVLYEPRFGNIMFNMDNIKTKKDILETYTIHVNSVMNRIANEHDFMSSEEKERKREYIIGIALEEFAINGYANTSMSSIAQKAEISIPILRSYFKKKEDILDNVLEWAKENFEPFDSEIEKRFLESITLTKEKFIELVMEYLDKTVLENKRIYIRKLLFREYYSNEKIKKYYEYVHDNIFKHVKSIMKHHIKTGLYKRHTDVDTMAIQFMAPFTQILLNVDTNEESKSIVKKAIFEHINQYWDFCIK